MTKPVILVVALAAACTDLTPPFSDHDEPSDFDELGDGKADGVPAVFDKNHIVDDVLFVGGGRMTLAGVQRFFEKNPYGTRSWLADAQIDGMSAAQAVIAAAAAENIHPLTLIVRMQVESSLVSKTARPSTSLTDRALGCGCPDGGGCSGQYRGLAKQLTCGARTFRRWYDASVDHTGEYVMGTASSVLDGSVRPSNHATASLYAYTPWIVSNKLVWNVYRKYAAHAATLGVLDTGPDDPGMPTTRWKPTANTSWQIQLASGAIDTSFNVTAYDIDLFDTPQATIDALHAAGRKVICYFSAGSHEDWRADAGQFPTSAIGNPLDGWPGERWLDTRSTAVRDRMLARMDLAKSKRCDAVDPDNVDGYTNSPGFALTAATQLDYNRFLARAAHDRGMAVGLKNDMDQIAQLVADFDFTVNEQCFEFDECDTLTPFIAANKPVFQLEYGGSSRAAAVCSSANARNFDTLVKNLSLDVSRIACR
jgi:hypothetical protein